MRGATSLTFLQIFTPLRDPIRSKHLGLGEASTSVRKKTTGETWEAGGVEGVRKHRMAGLL